MGKILKICVVLIVAVAAMWSCSSTGCIDNQNSIPLAGFYDSKTNLQELIQGKLKKEFHYELLEETGPEHDKTFRVEVNMEGDIIGKGQGRTKKAAEQEAAYEALFLLRERGIRK